VLQRGIAPSTHISEGLTPRRKDGFDVTCRNQELQKKDGRETHAGNERKGDDCGGAYGGPKVYGVGKSGEDSTLLKNQENKKGYGRIG